MTRKEAIKILNKYDLNFCDIDGNPIPPQDLAEAFDMAIEALQEPKQRHWVGTPQEFAEKMSQLAESGDAEADHIKADELMCQLLTSLGYGKGVKIFREMYKWYS